MSNTAYIKHESCALNNSNIVIDCHISNDCGLSNEAYLNFEMDLYFKEHPTINTLEFLNKQAILQSVSMSQISINGSMFCLDNDVLRYLKKFKNFEFSNFKINNNSDLTIEQFETEPNKIKLKWSEPIYHPSFLFNEVFKRELIGPIECYLSIALRPDEDLLLNSFISDCGCPINFEILNTSMLTKTLKSQNIPRQMRLPLYDNYKSPIGHLTNYTLVKSKSQGITLRSTPHKLFVFAFQKNPSYHSNFTSIKNLKLRINNEICVFKNTTPLILYNMAKKNGYDGDFNTWKNHSICCFDFCKDLNFHNNIDDHNRIDISAEIKHQCTISAEYELCFIVEYTGFYYKDSKDKDRYNYSVRNHPCSLID